MPNIKVLDRNGKEVSKMELSDAIFGVTPNEAVMHMAVVNYLANQRQGTQSTLTRTEVRGGGRKPWRQKGTGHARQGSIRAPQWRHGGIALGPKPRDYRFALNKKVRALALKSALSAKVQGGEMIVLDLSLIHILLENALYSVISPRGCASILWKDASREKEAAEVLKITAEDLVGFGVAEAIIPEANGDAHTDPVETAEHISQYLSETLEKLSKIDIDILLDSRYNKFRKIGVYSE